MFNTTTNTSTSTSNDDVYCGCGTICAERGKEVSGLYIDYEYRCCECGEAAYIRERRCNCGSEEPAKGCKGGGVYGDEYCG